ncbi:TIGR02452 family protein [Micromonospora zhanjiangensis]|uniref:TIGR02452 family protein n=1 Tax=Micromonospora zhanjiangensis TaxID=1522057 RepID=A0ABV8KQJ0_9ACTN
MDGKGSRREIARRTVAAVEAGGYQTADGVPVRVGDAVARALAGTRLYLPDDPLPAAGPAPTDPRPAAAGPAPTDARPPAAGPASVREQTPAAAVVEVTDETTLAAGRRLGPGTACLVFASAKNPGGGFLGGARAQEEDIARASALYACLLRAEEFYAFHRQQDDLRYSDRVIYSPDVPVIRDDRARLIEPYPLSFLTAAAPNLGAIRNNRPELAADVPAVLRRRAARVLAVAAAHGHRGLVLGAWGCGVFRNDPATVAAAFADALREVDRFDRVTFAVWDRAADSPTRRAFEQVFTGAAR